jgi:hypothetical protein
MSDKAAISNVGADTDRVFMKWPAKNLQQLWETFWP